MALDFTSFSAMSLLNQGPLPCLINTEIPPIPGLSLSTTPLAANDLNFPNKTEQQSIHGNVLTANCNGVTQLFLGWNEEAGSGTYGLSASMYIRSKNSSANSKWSAWAEVLDSQNFTSYIRNTYDPDTAVGVWGINITGTAENARYLFPIQENNETRFYTSFNMRPNTLPASNKIVWGEQFGIDGATYITNQNETVEYSNLGQIGFFLEPQTDQDLIKLNMYINGTYYGFFKGNLQGNATTATRAQITLGAANVNTLAYYSSSNATFSYTSAIHYIGHNPAELYHDKNNPDTFGQVNGLLITGTSQYAQNFEVADNRDIIAYGDAGPQLRFEDVQQQNSSTYGAIIFNSSTAASGYGPTFAFVSGYKNGSTMMTNHNVTLRSHGLLARYRAGIGVDTINTNYTFEVSGNSYFVGDIELGKYDTTNVINTTATLIFPKAARQQMRWTNDTTAVDNVNIGGLSQYGIGLYEVNASSSVELWYAISNPDGVNIITNGNLNLLHNSKVIPHTNNNTGIVGDVDLPVYINNGIITSINYYLKTNVMSTLNGNAFAYYDGTNKNVIATTTHYINDACICVCSLTPQQGYVFYVNGASYLKGDVTGVGTILPETNVSAALGAPATSGTALRWTGVFIGTDDTYGSGTQPIYWNNGVPAPTTYSLSATINSGTANTLAYYNTANLIQSTTITSDGTYLGSVAYLTINDTHQTTYRLSVNGTTLLKNTLSITASTPTINLHYGNSTGATASISSDGSGRIHLMYTGTTSLTYYSRSINANLYNEGIIYASNSIETNTQFVNNRETAGGGYLLYGNNMPYGSLVINSIGTTEANEIGQTILSIGNSIAAETANNAQGYIYLYGSNSNKTIIASQPNNGDKTFYLPQYNGNMYAIHAGSNAAIGNSKNPVYIAADGRATASSETEGSSVQPIYLNSGTLTESTSTVGSDVKPIYLNEGVITVSNGNVGDQYTPVYLSGGEIKEVTPVTYTEFTIANDTFGVQLNNNNFSAKTYVLAIVVKSGQDKLSAAIGWESGDKWIKLRTSTKVTGAVSGYIICARGNALAASSSSAITS